MLRDRLVVGIKDRAMSEKLQMDSELTLDKAKKTVRQKEAVKDQAKQLHGRHEATLEGIRFRGKGPRRGGVSGKQGGYPKGKLKPQCKRCGKDWHQLDKCSARDAICHKCSHKGHFAAQCFSKTTAATSTHEISIESAFLGALSTKNESQWTATVAVEDKVVEFKLDTGARSQQYQTKPINHVEIHHSKNQHELFTDQPTRSWTLVVKLR